MIKIIKSKPKGTNIIQTIAMRKYSSGYNNTDNNFVAPVEGNNNNFCVEPLKLHVCVGKNGDTKSGSVLTIPNKTVADIVVDLDVNNQSIVSGLQLNLLNGILQT